MSQPIDISKIFAKAAEEQRLRVERGSVFVEMFEPFFPYPRSNPISGLHLKFMDVWGDHDRQREILRTDENLGPILNMLRMTRDEHGMTLKDGDFASYEDIAAAIRFDIEERALERRGHNINFFTDVVFETDTGQWFKIETIQQASQVSMIGNNSVEHIWKLDKSNARIENTVYGKEWFVLIDDLDRAVATVGAVCRDLENTADVETHLIGYGNSKLSEKLENEARLLAHALNLDLSHGFPIQTESAMDPDPS